MATMRGFIVTSSELGRLRVCSKLEIWVELTEGVKWLLENSCRECVGMYRYRCLRGYTKDALLVFSQSMMSLNPGVNVDIDGAPFNRVKVTMCWHSMLFTNSKIKKRRTHVTEHTIIEVHSFKSNVNAERVDQTVIQSAWSNAWRRCQACEVKQCLQRSLW